jgi:hypothetical protein
MKVVSKKIEMIAWFKDDGGIRPLKFRMMEDEVYKVIVVDQIIKSALEKYGGNLMCVFECQSEIDERLRRYQLKYEIDTMKWILFKL